MADTKISAFTGGNPASTDVIPYESGASNNFGAVASAVGCLILLAEGSASASATLDFLSRNVGNYTGNLFQSDFDDYLIEIVGLVPATNSVGIGMRVSTDGATFLSTGVYGWAHQVYGAGGRGDIAGTAQTEMRLIGNVNASSTNTFSLNGSIRAFSPLSTALWKVFIGQINFWDTTPNLVAENFSNVYQATTAIVGIRFIATSGNLASGTVRIYGIRK